MSNYRVQLRPYSMKEILQMGAEGKLAKGNRLQAVIPADIGVIRCGQDCINEHISNCLVGDPVVLRDISYRVVGHERDTLHLSVSGDVRDWFAHEEVELHATADHLLTKSNRELVSTMHNLRRLEAMNPKRSCDEMLELSGKLLDAVTAAQTYIQRAIDKEQDADIG